ncbi:hypothetical protein QTP88_021696 [Uroleucon formosanum]
MSKERKEKVLQQKKNIQQTFWNDMGIKVDKIVQGQGTSNTGNVARRFFKNAEMSSKITGVDINLIKKLGDILIAISSGYEINFESFDQYCQETAKLYIELYNWYRMPPSMHKILLHGSIVIKHALVPIGLLSEEAQEAYPVISSKRKFLKTPTTELPASVKQLIITNDDEEREDSDISSDSE